MAFCGKCGIKVDDGVKFCPACGTEIGASSNKQQAYQPDTTANGNSNYSSSQDIDDNKLMAILAYLGILVLVPLLGAKNSKFARFHANQGLCLCIAEIAYWVGVSIIDSFIYVISWRLGLVVSGLLSFASLIFLIFIILGITNAVQGKAKQLPIIGTFRILK